MKVAMTAIAVAFVIFAMEASAIDPMGGAQQQMNQQIRQWQKEDIDKAIKPEPPEIIYGSQLMTPQEQAEYRAKIRRLTTREERDLFRAQHQRKMQERAMAQSMKKSEGVPAKTEGTSAPAAVPDSGAKY
jgi:hypothetical protein